MHGSIAARFAFLMLFAASATSAGESPYPVLDEIGRTVPGFSGGESGASAIFADFDGDGRLDAVVAGEVGALNGSVFEVIGANDNGVGIKQSLIIENTNFGLLIAAYTPPGQLPHLLAIRGDGTVVEISGWPLAQQRTFTIEPGAFSAVAGDIDRDGTFELVTRGSSSGLVAYDIATGTQKWSLPTSGYGTLFLANLDADSALEVVVGGSSGEIVDGATHAVEWSYPDGFGPALAAGHLTKGGPLELVSGGQSDVLTVFESSPWAPIWDFEIALPAAAVSAGDLDGDGIDEIVAADSQWGSIHVIDATTRAQRFEFPNPSWGVSALDVGDLTGSGTPSILFTSAYSSGDDPLLSIASGADGSLQHIVPREPGPFVAPLLAHIDDDTQLDLVYGEPRAGSSVRIVDAQSGAEEWRSPAQQQPADQPFAGFYATAFLLARTPSDRQLVLVGQNFYSTELISLEPRSKEILWRVGGTADSPYRDVAPGGAVLTDFNGDGYDDVAVCMHIGNSGGNRLYVFSGANGDLLWQSVAIGQSSPCLDVLAVNSDGQDILIAVIASRGLYAFDRHSRLLAWTLPAPIDGAALVPVGNQTVIATFSGQTVSLYDLATRSLQRTFEFDAAVSSVRALGPDSAHLVVASAGRLMLIDGVSGAVQQISDYLGGWTVTTPEAGSPLIAVADYGTDSYLVASTSQAGVFRHRVVLSERLFSDSFDPPPAFAPASTLSLPRTMATANP